jgi:Ca-activated chloride channel family protein
MLRLPFTNWSLSALALSMIALPATSPLANGDCARDAMLVFDGSGSMAEVTFDPTAPTKIADARRAIAQAIPDIAPLRRIGLLIYGPNAGDSCGGIDLRFAPKPNAALSVISAIDGIAPRGLTPLAASVHAAAQALNHRTQPGIVVVVTDGNETCGGRPCQTAMELAATSRDLTIHVIGFRATVDFWTWDNPEQEAQGGTDSVARCLADLTGGIFVKTQTVSELVEALQITLGCPLYGQITPTLPKQTKHRQTTNTQKNAPA